jgi:hypothetical protein
VASSTGHSDVPFVKITRAKGVAVVTTEDLYKSIDKGGKSNDTQYLI